MRSAILVAGLLFTTLVVGTTSTAYAVCCGSTCCSIDAMCRTQGTVDPDNACRACVPATTQFAWTVTTGCFIDGECQAEETMNPANVCEICDSARSKTAWSAIADCCTTAGDCDDSDDCTTDTCASNTCEHAAILDCPGDDDDDDAADAGDDDDDDAVDAGGDDDDDDADDDDDDSGDDDDDAVDSGTGADAGDDDDDDGAEDDGSCGCTVPGRETPPGFVLVMGGLFGLALRLRRRRR